MYKRNHEDMIKNSYIKSSEYHVEKDGLVGKGIPKDKPNSNTINNNKKLVKAAGPFIRILHDYVVESGFIIMLTDREGRILNITGDKDILHRVKSLNMVIGSFMEEGSIGNIAMRTAIKEGSPIQLSQGKNFTTCEEKWTCSSAPIHDGVGNIIGTLNLTGKSDLVHPHSLGFLVAAVKSIENQIKMAGTKKKLQEAYFYINTIMNSISSGIIAIDKDGIVKSINDTACKLLKVERKHIINKSIEKINSDWKKIFNDFKDGIDMQDEEVHIKIQAGRELYNMSAYPIYSEKSIAGMVILLKDMENVIKLVNKYSGMRARYTFNNFIGESLEILKIKAYAKNIADSTATVLIEGESGTGKEVLAQSIHNYSNRRDFGFVAINCGAISKNLIESELFGYDDGAFTGAKKGGNPGKFELANGGTLFLDEIGEMPLDMQVNLLRVLQEGVVTRVGGNKYIPVNVRVIAATNKDLRKEVARGNFRQDLYYRLSVIPIVIPPLRERKEDIPLLIKYFCSIKSNKLGKAIPKLSKEEYFKIINHPWKGNVRELENFLEKIMILGEDFQINLQAGEEGLEAEDYKEHIVIDKDILKEEEQYIGTLEDIEKKAIETCYRKFGGNITKIAKVLGIGRNTLYAKIKKYNIRLEGE